MFGRRRPSAWVMSSFRHETGRRPTSSPKVRTGGVRLDDRSPGSLPGPGTEHLAFENVDTETARLVGRLLGQSPVAVFSSPEGLW